MGYAKVVPSYEVHGDIPYNKSGRILVQVLSDALVESIALEEGKLIICEKDGTKREVSTDLS